MKLSSREEAGSTPSRALVPRLTDLPPSDADAADDDATPSKVVRVITPRGLSKRASARWVAGSRKMHRTMSEEDLLQNAMERCVVGLTCG